MKRPQTKHLWLALGLGAAALVAGSLILTAAFDLHPCHLCIFQRLLFMILAVLGLLAGLLPAGAGRWAGFAGLPVATLGAGVAGYQSWLEALPPGSASCMGGDPGLIERLVEWLAMQIPELFLATGFCEKAELSILGLTLANWALLIFTAFLVVALRALFNKPAIRP